MNVFALPLDHHRCVAVMLIVDHDRAGIFGFGFGHIGVELGARHRSGAVVVALCLEVAASIMQAFSVWRNSWKRVALLMLVP
jgi:hypothetical protein